MPASKNIINCFLYRAYARMRVRTAQRWLSGDRQIPDWLETVMVVRRAKKAVGEKHGA
jgi:hypothetical protein